MPSLLQIALIVPLADRAALLSALPAPSDVSMGDVRILQADPSTADAARLLSFADGVLLGARIDSPDAGESMLFDTLRQMRALRPMAGARALLGAAFWGPGARALVERVSHPALITSPPETAEDPPANALHDRWRLFLAAPAPKRPGRGEQDVATYDQTELAACQRLLATTQQALGLARAEREQERAQLDLLRAEREQQDEALRVLRDKTRVLADRADAATRELLEEWTERQRESELAGLALAQCEGRAAALLYLLRAQEQLTVEHSARLQVLADQNAQRDAELAAFRQQVADQEEDLARANRAIKDRDARIVALALERREREGQQRREQAEQQERVAALERAAMEQEQARARALEEIQDREGVIDELLRMTAEDETEGPVAPRSLPSPGTDPQDPFADLIDEMENDGVFQFVLTERRTRLDELRRQYAKGSPQGAPGSTSSHGMKRS